MIISLTTAFMQQFVELDNDKQREIVNFCVETEKMPVEQVAQIAVDPDTFDEMKYVQKRVRRSAINALRRRERKEKIVAENTAHKTTSQIATEKIVEIVNGPKPLMFSTELVQYALLLRVEGSETLSKREEEYAEYSAYHSFDPLFKDFQDYVFTRCCHYDGAPTEELRISCTMVFRDILIRIANELSSMFRPV